MFDWNRLNQIAMMTLRNWHNHFGLYIANTETAIYGVRCFPFHIIIYMTTHY